MAVAAALKRSDGSGGGRRAHGFVRRFGGFPDRPVQAFNRIRGVYDFADRHG